MNQGDAIVVKATYQGVNSQTNRAQVVTSNGDVLTVDAAAVDVADPTTLASQTKDQVTAALTSLQNLANTVASQLQATITALQAQVGSLQTQVATLTQQVTSLETTVAAAVPTATKLP